MASARTAPVRKKRKSALAPEQRYAAAIVGILLLILALVLTLTWQAWRAARGQRVLGEAAIADQATTAASMYRARVNAALYTALSNAFLPLAARRAGDTQVPSPEIVKAVIDSVDRCDCALIIPVPFVFRVDLVSGDVAAAGPETPTDERQRWIAGQISSHATQHYEVGQPFASFTADYRGESRMLSYSVVRLRDGTARWVVGFEADSATLARVLFQPRFRAPALFTNARLDSVQRDSVGVVRVEAPSGRIIYQSQSRFPERYVGRARLERFMGSLSLVVALHPAAVTSVLAPGVTRPDVPLLGTVLVLTAALLTLAVILLWRTITLARLRADFTASVSHELRTPLAQIMLFAETMAHGRLATIADYRRESNVILQEGRRLLHLVENVLHFARAERLAIPLNLRPLLLAPVVRDTLQSFAPLAAEAELVIRTAIDDEVWVVVDAGAVRRALTNLLENSVKYARAGQQISVGVSLEGDRALIRVDDCGPGIPHRDRERVWHAFTRLERDVDRATAGSGIGLAIVRDIVRGHQGRAWVEDSPFGGARFVLEFPGAWRVQPGHPDAPAVRAGAAVSSEDWAG
jgi:signal transduction histidine kinase